MWLLRELLFYLKPAFKALKQATVPILIFMLSALIAHDAAQMSRSAYCRPPIPGDDRDVSGLSTLVNRKSPNIRIRSNGGDNFHNRCWRDSSRHVNNGFRLRI